MRENKINPYLIRDKIVGEIKTSVEYAIAYYKGLFEMIPMSMNHNKLNGLPKKIKKQLFDGTL